MTEQEAIGSDRAKRPEERALVADIRGVTKHYTGVQALTDASLQIHRGEVRALLGRNGAGKSTLIRLLSGVELADNGAIVIDDEELGVGGVRRSTSLGVQTVHQELSLVPGMTVAENLFLGSWPRSGGRVDYPAMQDAASQVLAELELKIDPRAAVGNLPLAEQQLVEICRAVRREPKLLILDEPTSALAAAEVDLVLSAVERIAARGVAVVYVSHRLEEIRRVAEAATVMRDGRVVETVALDRTSTEQVVKLMVGETGRAAERPEVRTIDRTNEPLLSVEGLALPPKVVDVSFEVFPGEILGIAGLMGSGRSEILRAIAGFDPITSGKVTVDGTVVSRPNPARMKRLGIGMTPENRKSEAIVPFLGVDENMVLSDFADVSSGPTISRSRMRAAADALVERLAIATKSSSTPIVNLSGGNQQKAVIGRWLHAGSRILLLDEPTRGVDVQAKAEIYRLARDLADHGAAIVFVSGELEELPLVCDRVIALRDGGVAAEMTGADITVDSVLSAAMAA